MTDDTSHVADENVTELHQRPSKAALRWADKARSEAEGWGLPLRRSFINRQAGNGHDSAPPILTDLLRRGGGLDAVRLKLYLSLLWIGARKPRYTIDSSSSRAWAQLLDLPDPMDAGSRRIRDAITYLSDASLIRVRRRHGRDPVITIRREDASGRRYSNPAETDPVDPYVLVPRELWTNGWLSVLSGPALTTLLIVGDSADDGLKHPSPVWLSGTARKDRYDISADTWQSGVRELMAHELLRRRTSYIEIGDGFGDIAKRVTVRFAPDRLKSTPSRSMWQSSGGS